MKITYDSSSLEGYIYFRKIENGGVKESLTFEGPLASLVFDIGADGELLGIEFLRTDKTLFAEGNKLTITNQRRNITTEIELP